MMKDDKTMIRDRAAVDPTPYALDRLVPDQVGCQFWRARLQPEARLALAVLEDAAETLRTTCGVDSLRARRLARHAWSWVESDATDHAFTFRVICQHLEIDAEWLRKGLERWRPTATGSPRTHGRVPARRAKRAAA